MHTLSKVALLAVVAGLTTVPSVMAAPPMSQQQMAAFCQTHPQDPQCNLSGGQGQGTGHNQGHQPGTTPNPPAGSPPPPTPGAGPNNGSSLSFNFSSGDRSQFHSRFRGLNFGTFGVPGFSISIGTTVPHSYGLKPVPRTIYKYYPQFRGYLFFVGRHGDFVIVSPRSYRVVAVL